MDPSKDILAWGEQDLCDGLVGMSVFDDPAPASPRPESAVKPKPATGVRPKPKPRENVAVKKTAFEKKYRGYNAREWEDHSEKWSATDWAIYCNQRYPKWNVPSWTRWINRFEGKWGGVGRLPGLMCPEVPRARATSRDSAKSYLSKKRQLS